MTARRWHLATVLVAALAVSLAVCGPVRAQQTETQTQTSSQPETSSQAATAETSQRVPADTSQSAPETTVQPQPSQPASETPAASQPAASAPAASQSNGEQPAPAETQAETPTAPADKRTPGQKADDWKIELDNMALAIEREGISEEQLTAQRARAEQIIEEARQLESQLAPQVAAIQARLNQLGPAPAEGEPAEAPDIAERRAAESAALAKADSALKKTRIAIVQAEQIIRDAASLRRDRFTRSLTVRNSSVLDPNLWLEGLQALPRVTRSFGILFTDSWSVASNQINARAIAILAGAIAAAIFLGVYLRRHVRKLAPPVGDSEEVPRLRKLSRAALVVFADGLIPVLAVGLLYFALNQSGLVSDRLAELNRGIIAAVAVFAFLFGLSRALCAPLRPGWRLVGIPDTVAAQTVVSITGIAIVLAIAAYLETANEVLFAPVSVDIVKRAVSVILVNAFLATGLWRLAVAEREQPALGEGQGIVVWHWLRGVIWVVVLANFIALLAGYIALANFMTVQIVFASAIIALVWLLLGLIEELVNTTLQPENRASHMLASAFGVSEAGVTQLALIASGVMRLAVIVLGAVLILIPWGFDTGEWRIWIQKAFFGFRVGGVNISLASILTALIILAIGLVATRAIQGWLGNRFLPNTKLDLGLRNSIRTIVGYVGIIITAIFAVTFMGFNLQNIAIVAGALSVGIGFGLQSIVNNFVSGLILLAERPIKEGDWIVVGTEQGNVRKISIRSTEIETFDRATVIVPNSDLITGTVKNWMHSSMMGRVIVPVGVSYSADPEQVRDILLDVARQHTGVLAYPEPRVYFSDFGDSSLVFDLFAYIGDVNNSLTVRSDFRFEIFKRLRDADIEIPFPQRDIHLRDIDRLEAAITKSDAGTVEAGPAPVQRDNE